MKAGECQTIGNLLIAECERGHWGRKMGLEVALNTKHCTI
jgi:hypothetical protein